MSSASFNNVEQYIVRIQSSISVDYVEIIPYPNHHIISWNIIPSTQTILSDFLCEDFHDLLLTLNLVRVDKNKEMLTLDISGSSGTIELTSLPIGNYHCELVVINSQNETITIKKSTSLFITAAHKQTTDKRWRDVTTINKNSWFDAFSGYSVYE